MFDLGGVLVELDPLWPARLGLDPDAVNAWCAASPELQAFECGELSESRFLRALGAAFRCSDMPALRQAFAGHVRGLYPGATELLAELGPERTAALSNTNRIHWAVFDPERALRSGLGVTLASHHLGARKPEPTAFSRASAMLGTSDVLFLDDTLRNVDAARAFGWRAEQVVGPEQAREVVRATLLSLR
ncbi:MAG: HAD-IA family hydrolase [Myxococcota bacterium]